MELSTYQKRKARIQREDALRDEREHLQLKVMAGMSTADDHKRAMVITKELYFNR